MSKVLYHVTMSLDGFITGPDGDMSWLGAYVGPNPTVTEVISRIGAVLIGNRTFSGENGAGTDRGRAYGGGWTGPQFVLTHHVSEVPGYVLVDDLRDGVARAREAAGDKYVAILGADTARQCLDAGLVDEILVHVVPLLLGDGARLYTGAGRVALELTERTGTGAVTNLWFRVLG